MKERTNVYSLATLKAVKKAKSEWERKLIYIIGNDIKTALYIYIISVLDKLYKAYTRLLH